MIKFKKVAVTIGVASALALGSTLGSATPFSPATSKAEAAYYNSCHTDLTGVTWCYRVGCTAFEYYALGCRDGWVATNRWHA